MVLNASFSYSLSDFTMMRSFFSLSGPPGSMPWMIRAWSRIFSNSASAVYAAIRDRFVFWFTSSSSRAPSKGAIRFIWVMVCGAYFMFRALSISLWTMSTRR
ncbi:MAG: hypothetical protein A4E37_00125 [Methanoregulaceae archaeon PtaB.Bin056]|nr:MAG: hypothetical protein A4E37_00125 [Methanoregulaceae archaeon PtaB.Bin056]